MPTNVCEFSQMCKCWRMCELLQMYTRACKCLQMSANVQGLRPEPVRGGTGEGAPLQPLTPHHVISCGELARRLWRNYPAAQDVGPIWWRGPARTYVYRCEKSLQKMKKSVKNICKIYLFIILLQYRNKNTSLQRLKQKKDLTTQRRQYPKGLQCLYFWHRTP